MRQVEKEDDRARREGQGQRDLTCGGLVPIGKREHGCEQRRGQKAQAEPRHLPGVVNGPRARRGLADEDAERVPGVPQRACYDQDQQGQGRAFAFDRRGKYAPQQRGGNTPADEPNRFVWR